MTVPYDPIQHQHAFAAVFDIEAAATNRSFDRFRRKIRSLLEP